jgi:hypothetical protein
MDLSPELLRTFLVPTVAKDQVTEPSDAGNLVHNSRTHNQAHQCRREVLDNPGYQWWGKLGLPCHMTAGSAAPPPLFQVDPHPSSSQDLTSLTIVFILAAATINQSNSPS